MLKKQRKNDGFKITIRGSAAKEVADKVYPYFEQVVKDALLKKFMEFLGETDFHQNLYSKLYNIFFPENDIDLMSRLGIQFTKSENFVEITVQSKDNKGDK